jgi:peroxiredoxin Q/BCP
MPLNIGNHVPTLEVKNQNGNAVKLSDFLGKKIVLYFYPQDNTPTCTVEACNLRDNYEALQKQGYVVLGVSPDSEAKHQKFIEKQKLPFDLLADTDLKLCQAFGVWAEKKTFGKTYMGVLRTTFVIDETGKIIEVIEKVESKNHAQQILK